MKTIRLHPPVLVAVSQFCAYMVHKARQSHCRVELAVDGLLLVATPKKSPATLEWEYCVGTTRAGRVLLWQFFLPYGKQATPAMLEQQKDFAMWNWTRRCVTRRAVTFFVPRERRRSSYSLTSMLAQMCLDRRPGFAELALDA